MSSCRNSDGTVVERGSIAFGTNSMLDIYIYIYIIYLVYIIYIYIYILRSTVDTFKLLALYDIYRVHHHGTCRDARERRGNVATPKKMVPTFGTQVGTIPLMR